MLIACVIHSMILITSHTSAQNKSSTESSISNTSPLLRRKWPTIKFEDFYQSSGDGPLIEENITESFAWTTIVTQIKASLWPIISRIKITTPNTKSIQASSTLFFSSDLFSWGSSYGYAISSNSQLFSESILSRSSVEYLGPSASIKCSKNVVSSEIISFSQLPSDLNSINTIRPSTQSYISTTSVIHSDRLSEYFSTDKYTSSLSNFEINSGTHSVPQIYSSLVFSETELITHAETTPIQSMAITTVEDKNSIYASHPQNLLSTAAPFISSIDPSLHFSTLNSSSIQSNSLSLITISKAIDTLLTTKLGPFSTPQPTPTSNPSPLCPEGLQTELPKAYTFEKPIENYLIRTVLNNTSNESIANIKSRIAENIKQIYVYAFGKQYQEIDQKIGIGRKLHSDKNPIIDVKLWDLSIKNASQQIHVIYYVEKDGTLIPYEDALRTLSYITDDKYSQMIGIDVIEKVKPYNERLVAKSGMNWLGIILISCSGLLFIICIVAGLGILYKYKSEKRKWIDVFHMELNRVVPDNQIHWRTVSHHIAEPKSTTTPKETDNSEFQYMHFRSDKKNSEPKRKITASKGIQSNLQMQKEKVIPIAKIINDCVNSNETTTTFVTTKDINTGEEDNSIPRIIEVQMSEQTQSIIRAIRKELRKFGNYSLSFNGSQTEGEGSIISNSSEA